MKERQIDEIFGQTPCLCGNVETWHPECYKGKSKAQVEASYKAVYLMLRAYLRSLRRKELVALLNRVRVVR